MRRANRSVSLPMRRRILAVDPSWRRASQDEPEYRFTNRDFSTGYSDRRGAYGGQVSSGVVATGAWDDSALWDDAAPWVDGP
jgi:hypothetical protein